MGCTSGKAPGEAERSHGGSKDAPASKEEKLLDKYVLGKVLGQGAFGVVYSCKKKGTKEEFAVKMIDQVETPVAEIKQEAEMLNNLCHPCIVKLHDVYYEKVFVCMVLEIYKGGDMIEGMQLHWKSKGMIPVSVCQNLTKMMFQSIDWLHQNNVVHRDIKGDNYLQDRREIEHPNCRIYLSDFGTVVEMPPGGRLKQRCGTKTYWAPEFYALNYGIKVDIWALGVVLFGMVTGRFPFKGEEDTKSKAVKTPSRVAEDGGDFIKRTLDRDESKRISAKEALQHRWLSTIRSAAEHEVEKMEPGFQAEVREAGANAGIKERRRELVERLQDASQRRPESRIYAASKEQLTKGFEVFNEHMEATVKFEWWTPAQVQAANFYDEAKAVRPKEEDVEAAVKACQLGIKEMFEGHGIDTSNFGKGQAKKLIEFVHEVQTGQARLMLDATKHKTVVRVVDVVLVRIVYGEGSGKKFLIKSAEKYPDGRLRDGSQLAGVKKLPHENGIMTAERLVKERLPILEGSMKFNFNIKECYEEEENSPSYPGVRTVYRKEIYEGVVTATDAAVLQKFGLAGTSDGRFSQEDDKNYTRYFCWLTEKECESQKIKLKAPAVGSEVSALVAPPIGYEEEQLQQFLQASNVDISQFGKNDVKSLAEFSEELVKGESTLMVQNDSSLIRVVDVVILKIFNTEGNTLVEVLQTDVNGQVKATNRLPAVKRRSDENQFWAAHRVMLKNLRLSEDLVQMDPKNVQLVEDQTTSKAYAGLPTLYRRRIIPCKLTNIQTA